MVKLTLDLLGFSKKLLNIHTNYNYSSYTQQAFSEKKVDLFFVF